MINQLKAQLKRFWKWLIALIFGGMVLAMGTQTTLLDTSVINYPLTANTNIEKLEYLYSAQEALNLENNELWKKVEEGKITKIERQIYLEEEYRPKMEWLGWAQSVIGEELGEVVVGTTISTSTGEIVDKKVNARQYYKEFMKQSKTWKIDLDNILKK